MIIDLTVPVKGINKEPLKDKDGTLVTLKKMVLLGFMQPDPAGRGSTPQDAVKHRKLMNKIDEAQDKVELSVEEVVRVKEIVCARLTDAISGELCLLMDPES